MSLLHRTMSSKAHKLWSMQETLWSTHRQFERHPIEHWSMQVMNTYPVSSLGFSAMGIPVPNADNQGRRTLYVLISDQCYFSGCRVSTEINHDDSKLYHTS